MPAPTDNNAYGVTLFRAPSTADPLLIIRKPASRGSFGLGPRNVGLRMIRSAFDLSARISLVYGKRTEVEKQVRLFNYNELKRNRSSPSPELSNPNERRVRFSRDNRTWPNQTKGSLISPCWLTFGERAHQKKSGIRPQPSVIRGGRYLLSRN